MEPQDTRLRPSGKVADWDDYLKNGNNLQFIPPVTYFKSAPLADVWEDLARVGLVVEVANPFVRCPRPINWISNIRHYAGYKALVEFETLGTKLRHVSWMSFCSDVPKHLGYSDKNRLLLYPPHCVRSSHPDFLNKVREVVKNCPTVAENHGELIKRLLMKTQKYKLLTTLEVMDRDNAARMRVATVTGLIGNRIHVTYVIEPRKDDIGYWFSVNSDYVHPIGWSQTIGQEIYGVPNGANFIPLDPNYFPKYSKDLVLVAGQMLEARHPMRPYQICAASVYRVLEYGYFVAEFRTTAKEQEHLITFTFHVTSPFVFPCGFCVQNNIEMIPPFDESSSPFDWKTYLDKFRLQAAPLDLIPPRNPHKFQAGMKMEASGILDPTYLGPATVRKVRAHLLYLSFDGWPALLTDGDTHFWTHAESSEIYPVGFAEMVGHNFQGRVQPNDLQDIQQEQLLCDQSASYSTPSTSSSTILDE